jgi:hypothetical protein
MTLTFIGGVVDMHFVVGTTEAFAGIIDRMLFRLRLGERRLDALEHGHQTI